MKRARRGTGSPAFVALVLLAAAVSSGTAGAQDEEDNELDRFMDRVLAQREVNSITRMQYVLDEEERFRFMGPGDELIWGSRREYTWYARDGLFVRSPVRIDGVTIDEERRREYEADWLRQEERRARRRPNERTPPTRLSRRSTRRNVELSIERLWGGDVDARLLNAIARDARAWSDDHAAIVAAAGRILEARGGVEAVGFDRSVERARDGFAMLEAERLYPDEVAAMLDEAVDGIARGAAAATDAEFGRFIELFDLAVRFELKVSPPDPALADAVPDSAVRAARRNALEEARSALQAVPEPAGLAAATAGGSSEPPWSGIQPRFVSDSYFLDFEFEPGNYYLAGRETLAGRDVLRIEYYPEHLFSENPDAPGGDDADDAAGRGRGGPPQSEAMDKTSLVTLWVDPEEHQIVRYTFDNLGFGFMPARWFVRVDDLTASMTMGQPVDGVWLPEQVAIRVAVSTAEGTATMSATREFTNYREAESGGRIRSVGPPVR